MRRLVAVVTLVAFTASMVVARRARADEPAPSGSAEDPALSQAKARFEAGRTAYLARDYAGAIREFRAAEAIRPSPILEYNIAMAYEALGKPRQALHHYRRYLEGRPDADNRAEVERRIAALQAEPTPPPATIAPPATPAEPTAPPPSTVNEPQQEPIAQPQPGPVEQQPPPQPMYGQPVPGEVVAPPAEPPPARYDAATDPYARYQAFVPPSAPTRRRPRNLWWLVFPIAGGIALTAVLIWVGVTYGG